MKGRSECTTTTTEEAPGKPRVDGACAQQVGTLASAGAVRPGMAWPPGSRTPGWHQSHPAWTYKLFNLPLT